MRISLLLVAMSLQVIAAPPTQVGNESGLFSAEARRLEGLLSRPSGAKLDKKALLALVVSCNESFWLLFAPGNDIPSQAERFVSEFGRGDVYHDFLWLQCEPLVTCPVAVTPLANGIPPYEGAGYETKRVQIEVARAQLRRFGKDRKSLRRYYQAVLWQRQAFGGDPWHGLTQRVLPRIEKHFHGGQLVEENACYYGRSLLLVSHMLSIELTGELESSQGVRAALEQCQSAIKRSGQLGSKGGEYRWESGLIRGLFYGRRRPPAWDPPTCPFSAGPHIRENTLLSLRELMTPTAGLKHRKWSVVRDGLSPSGTERPMPEMLKKDQVPSREE